MPDSGLFRLFVLMLTGSPHGLPASMAGMSFAWCMAAAFLLIGAHSLRLFDRRPAMEREPLWLTAGPGRPLVLTALIGVAEELLFRGYLQSVALSMADPVYALFAVNLLFALIHFKGGLTFALSAGFFGMMASVMTLASASLLPAIVMHAGWNLLMGLARRREAAREASIRLRGEPGSA